MVPMMFGRDLRPEAVGREQDGVAGLEPDVAAQVDLRRHHAAQAAVDLVAVRVLRGLPRREAAGVDHLLHLRVVLVLATTSPLRIT
jgi:hypothetical protein